MGYSITIHTKINPDCLESRIKQANLELGKDVKKDCDPFTPIRSGKLRQLYSIDGDRPVHVTWKSPYAHYMYEGKTMVSPTGSAWAKLGQSKHYDGGSISYGSGGSKWFEKAEAASKSQWLRSYKKMLTRG